MEQDDDKYRSSDDEDYDGAGSEESPDETSDIPPQGKKAAAAKTTGKRRRSTRHDALDEIDATEAAELKAAAREAYGEAFLADATAAQATSALSGASLDAMWADMNREAPRPRLALVGGLPLAQTRGPSRTHGPGRIAECVRQLARGVPAPSAAPAPIRIDGGPRAALEVRRG